MNYVCTINPGRISKITGKITDLAGNSMFSTSGISSVLHYVNLDDPVTTNIPIGTIFGFNGGQSGGSTTTGFKTAFYINEGSSDLYFYNDVATLNSFTGSATRETGSSTSGLNGLTANTSKYREADFPRFTAEFVIVSK